MSLKIAYVNEGRNLHRNKKALFRISVYKAICKKPVTSTAAFILVLLKEEEPKRVTALRLFCVSEMYCGNAFFSCYIEYGLRRVSGQLSWP
jgi:hypothetical protein